MLLRAGVGFKPDHFEDAMAAEAPGLFFEVHPENYMADGGPRPLMLAALAERHPVSLHSVSLSLAADADPDPDALARLARLTQTVKPALVSEHLAWSAWAGAYRPDLLPFPRTQQALTRICANIQRVQEALGRPILIENPSLYLELKGHDFSEPEFLREIVRTTGCGLLLDVNNVYVSSRNLNFEARAYLAALPAAAIGEIHLAGYSLDPEHGEALLIDSHDAPVGSAVWGLYAAALKQIGPRPTLIERDGNLPPFQELMDERARASALLEHALPFGVLADA